MASTLVGNDVQSAVGEIVVTEDNDVEQGQIGANGPMSFVGCATLTIVKRDQLQHWRGKIPLQAIIEGRQDRRSITGLKRAADRLLSKPDSEVVGAQLMQFYRQVQAASQLSPGCFNGCPTEEVHKICDLLLADDVPLPEELQFRILMRRVNRLVSESAYPELLHVLNPWLTCGFEHVHPRLAGLHDDLSRKLVLYKKFIFNELICKFIMKGPDGAPICLSVSKQCLRQSEEVDYAFLDAASSIALDEIVCCWKALTALLATSLDSALEETYIKRQMK
eukprot:3274929-Amphidinium_carterae.3